MALPILPFLLITGAGVAIAAAASAASGKKQASPLTLPPPSPYTPPEQAPAATYLPTRTPALAVPPPTPVSPVTVTTPGVASSPPGQAVLPEWLQKAVAEAIQKVTPEALSAVAYQAANLGFHGLAADLNARAAEASKARPAPSPANTIQKIEPKLPDDLAAQVDRVLRDNANPIILDNLAAQLERMGYTTTADVLRSKANEVKAAEIAAAAMKDIEATVKAAENMPTPSAVPDAVVPSKPDGSVDDVLRPKTAQEIMAEKVQRHLKPLQQKHGMPGAKGKEDFDLIRKFQAQENLTQDGKMGPGGMKALAKYVHDLPLVMYWPVSATAENVLAYRSDLEALASATTDEMRAAGLLLSASRERGQAGIVGKMPA